MDAFANPFPGAVFFDLFMHAPADELAEVNALASKAARSTEKGASQARAAIHEWIGEFVEQRRGEEPRGDVVDAVINADIDGRAITPIEIVGVIQLLLFGGLDTTAGALGQMMIRFCQNPEIPALLRAKPELLPEAVEELLAPGPALRVHRPHRHPRHRDRRVPGGRGRQGADLVGVGQPRRSRVPRPRRLPPRPRVQPPHRLRRRPSSLRGVQPGPHEPAHRGGGAGQPPRRPEAGRRRRAHPLPLALQPHARPWCPSPSRQAPDSVRDPSPSPRAG